MPQAIPRGREWAEIKQSLIIALITFLILFNLALLDHIYRSRENKKAALAAIRVQTVEDNMVRLEGAISYEKANHWKNDFFVLEKLQDVEDGIQDVLVLGRTIHGMTQQQEALMMKLSSYFKAYNPSDTGYPNVALSQTRHTALERLGTSLVQAGFGMGMTYKSDWADFSRAVEQMTGSS